MIRVKATLKVGDERRGREEQHRQHNVFVVDASATSEPIAEPRGGLPKSAPRGKGVGNCEEEEQESSQNVPLGIVDLFVVFLMCCQTTTRPQKTLLLLMNLWKNPQGLCHRCHLFPGSRTQGFQGTQKGTAGSFGKKQCNGNDCRDGEESSFFDCWYWRHKQSDILQHADPWVPNEPKSRSSAKVCLSVNFSICSVCQKLGVYKPRFANEQLPPHYDIPGEGECRHDEVPIEIAPCEVWLLDEVELKTVTFSNMSIDSKLVETVSQVDTEKSPFTLVRVNQL